MKMEEIFCFFVNIFIFFVKFVKSNEYILLKLHYIYQQFNTKKRKMVTLQLPLSIILLYYYIILYVQIYRKS